MNEGTLYFDKSSDRYDIVFPSGAYYEGLHCGNCFDVWLGDDWISTRIEADNDGWYLCAFHHQDGEQYQGAKPGQLDGLTVRI